MLSIQGGMLLDREVSDYVVFDLETTGISPQNDKIIEISAIKVEAGKAVDEFNTLVNPMCHIPSGASYVNGITDSMVKDSPTIDEVMPKFIEFIGDMVLLGHNIHGFDMAFILRESSNCMGLIPDNDYVDTLPVSKKCLPQLAHHRMTDLAQHYGISSDGAHRALNDCRMTWMVYERLKQEKSDSQKVKTCGLCGKPMVLRSGRFGRFWGCSGYPECRFTEKV